MADNQNSTMPPAIAGPVTMAAVALPVTAAATAATKDPLTTVIDRHDALWEACPDGPSGQSEWNRNLDALAEEMGRTAPTTKRGAIAGLRYIERLCGDWAITDREQRMLRNCIDFLAGRERLESLIEAYRKSRAVYHGSLAEEDNCDSPEWDAYIDAESALIAHPCTDDDERRTKIAFATTDELFFDTLQNDRRGEVPELLRFLRSLA